MTQGDTSPSSRGLEPTPRSEDTGVSTPTKKRSLVSRATGGLLRAGSKERSSPGSSGKKATTKTTSDGSQASKAVPRLSISSDMAPSSKLEVSCDLRDELQALREEIRGLQTAFLALQKDHSALSLEVRGKKVAPSSSAVPLHLFEEQTSSSFASFALPTGMAPNGFSNSSATASRSRQEGSITPSAVSIPPSSGWQTQRPPAETCTAVSTRQAGPGLIESLFDTCLLGTPGVSQPQPLPPATPADVASSSQKPVGYSMRSLPAPPETDAHSGGGGSGPRQQGADMAAGLTAQMRMRTPSPMTRDRPMEIEREHSRASSTSRSRAGSSMWNSRSNVSRSDAAGQSAGAKEGGGGGSSATTGVASRDWLPAASSMAPGAEPPPGDKQTEADQEFRLHKSPSFGASAASAEGVASNPAAPRPSSDPAGYAAAAATARAGSRTPPAPMQPAPAGGSFPGHRGGPHPMATPAQSASAWWSGHPPATGGPFVLPFPDVSSKTAGGRSSTDGSSQRPAGQSFASDRAAAQPPQGSDAAGFDDRPKAGTIVLPFQRNAPYSHAGHHFA